MTVLVVDYEMCNLGSVRRAFEECGASVLVSRDPGDLASCAAVVLPGVGSFNDGMANLDRMGWTPALREAALAGVPLLGICLGMQLLADRGEEGGDSEGLGLIAGQVVRLQPGSPAERIPHMGWNEVVAESPDPMFRGVADGSDFYFVHSYHFQPGSPASVVATTPYAGGFVSAVRSGSVFGVQFHPEKSGRPGFQLIRNFLDNRLGEPC